MDEHQPFNLHDIVQVVQRRQKPILLFVSIVVVLTTLLVFFVMPKYYRATSIIVAANPELADKSRIFNDNIEQLYSNFGTADDLDRLLAISRIDNVYATLVRKYNLGDYYKIKDDNLSRREGKAMKALKDDVEIEKSELNELKISATTKDPQLSSNIVNDIVEQVQRLEQNVWKQEYNSAIEKIDDEIISMEQQPAHRDSILTATSSNELITMLQKKRTEYKLAFENAAPALIVLQPAYPSSIPYKPKKLLVILTAFLTSLAFGVFAALLFDRQSV